MNILYRDYLYITEIKSSNNTNDFNSSVSKIISLSGLVRANTPVYTYLY